MEAGGLDAVLSAVLDGLAPEVRESRELYFRCRCDRDRLRHHLSVMSEEDRTSLQEDTGELEAECVFCGTVYRFEAAELDGSQPASEVGADA
jgi:molecular chaperone Hsp33